MARPGPRRFARFVTTTPMESLIISDSANCAIDDATEYSADEASHAARPGGGPLNASAWNEAELTDAILVVCDEIPYAPMAACWRALEHSRHSTPRGTQQSLIAAMGATLRHDMRTHGTGFAAAA
jgi:hypothetical protein